MITWGRRLGGPSSCDFNREKLTVTIEEVGGRIRHYSFMNRPNLFF